MNHEDTTIQSVDGERLLTDLENVNPGSLQDSQYKTLSPWSIEDFRKSGIAPEDFPLPIIETSKSYKIRYTDPVNGEPMLDLQGREYYREKFKVPVVNKEGKLAKYNTGKGAGMRVFFPRGIHELLTGDKQEYIVGTEGEKKAICATVRGLPCIGLAGVWGWLESKEKRSDDKYMLHADLTPYLKEKDFLMIYDSDAVDESKALDFDYCAYRFAEALDKHGRKLYRVNLPADGSGKVGLDDYLLKHSVEELREYIQGNKQIVDPRDNPKYRKPQVLLPGANGKLVSEFAKECFKIISKSNEMFLYSDNVCRIATTKKKDAKTEKERDIVGFKQVTSSMLITEVEKYLIPVILAKKDSETIVIPHSIGEQLARTVSSCYERDRLPTVRLISSVSLPYLKDGEICLTDPGYDKSQEVWTDTNCPKLNPIPLEMAIEVFRELFSEFCFLEPELDLSRSIAYLLTPMLKLIVGECRAMIFYASGNRPGVGKDLLLGLNPVLYTGREPFFASPCQDDAEYRKLIFAACKEGAEFLLISNISGHLKSDPIEQGATSIHLSGRVLGLSENRRLLNNGIWGISGNGLSLSEDLVRRCLEIRLEKYEEDITQQTFKHSDLYGYVLENREKILSALLTLIVNWKTQGAPLGASVRSFTKWSQTTSGILTAAGLTCPFVPRQKLTPSMTLGGNRDTTNLKSLVEAWHERHGINNVKADDLRVICTEYALFAWLDMESRSGIVKFTKLLTRFAEREFSGLKIHIEDNAKYKAYYLEKVTI